MTSLLFAAVIFVALLGSTQANGYRHYKSKLRCRGTQTFKVTFHMKWTKSRFGNSVPYNAHVSPLTTATHTKRFSPFSLYGYADKAVETVAESGNNMPLIQQLRANPMVYKVAHLSKPTSNKGPATVHVQAKAGRQALHLSAIAMLAPTPDWIVAINNVELCRKGRWARKIRGSLYAWDAGTQKSMSVDQSPRQNIYRITSGRYYKHPVGHFTIYNV